jgi:TonB-linked SusC/RagA family outer membrane protein
MKITIDYPGMRRVSSKTWLIMKMTAFLLTIALVQVSAKSISQKITYSGKNVSMEKIFNSIRQQTSYAFFYNYRLLEATKPVSLDVKNASLEEVLNLCFKDQPVTYSIEDKTIVVTTAPVLPVLPVTNDIPPPPPLIDVKGKVIDEQGQPVAFASVITKKERTGGAADADGNFTVKADPGEILIVSSVGFEPKEVTAATGTLSVVLKRSTSQTEIVVTALGISKSKKSLGYAVQTVTAEEVNKLRGSDITSALAGKVAGAQILGTPGGNFGEGQLRIRGASSIGGTDPIFVVDGTVVNLSAVNMDDIEVLSVLKGPSATALYGFRGAGGVVMITTKKGKKKASSVTINSLTEIGNVYLIPPAQNEYGVGTSGSLAFPVFMYNAAIHPASWASFNGQKIIEYAADENWGPKLDGTLYRDAYSWYPGDDFGKLTAFSPNADGLRNFYQSTLRTNNNVVFEGGGTNSTYRISYNNRVTTLPTPNSKKTEHIITMKGTLDVSPKLAVSTNINFLSYYQLGERTEGYNGQNVSRNFNQFWQRQLRFEQLKEYINPTGGFKTYNITSPTNLKPFNKESPYFLLEQNFQKAWQNRIYGDVGLSYKIFGDLKLTGTARVNVVNSSSDARLGSFSQLQVDSYSISNGQSGEFNAEMLAEYKHVFGDFSVEQYVGGNFRNDFARSNSSGTVGGLSVPGLYSVTASKDRPTVSNSWREYQINSLYARGSVGYKNYLFLDYSLRNDWSSSLPVDKNSYLYPSVSMSFVFTDLIKSSRFKNLLNFGKLRAAYGRVGADLGAYVLNQTYGLGSPYGTNPTMSVPTTVYDPLIKPSLSREYEFGTELQFLKNRFSMDITVYRKDGVDQIIPLQTDPTSGSSTVYLNAGLIRSEGWELVLAGQPVKTRDFSWNVQLNVARNVSKVINLDTAKNLRNYNLGTATGGPSVNSRVGEQFATFVGQVTRRDAKTGLPVINSAGTIQFDRDIVMGTALPDYTGGLVTSFTYKDLTLSGTFSFQSGGQYFSSTRKYSIGSGTSLATVGLNDKGVSVREPVSAGGGVRVDGVLNGTPTTMYVEARNYFKNVPDLHDMLMVSASYLKMAEVRISYNLPVTKWTKFIKNASASLFVRNPWLITASAKEWGFDPSEIENGDGYYEGGQIPNIRSVGVNLSIRF